MKLVARVPVLLCALTVGVGTEAGIDRKRVEREVMAVLDAYFDAFNRQDARAEERTYHFPHYRLASGRMGVFDAPGTETEAWMNDPYKTFRESGWDHKFTRYRKDGSVIGRFESLYILTKEDGRWGIKMRSSFETLIK